MITKKKILERKRPRRELSAQMSTDKQENRKSAHLSQSLSKVPHVAVPSLLRCSVSCNWIIRGRGLAFILMEHVSVGRRFLAQKQRLWERVRCMKYAVAAEATSRGILKWLPIAGLENGQRALELISISK